MNCEEVVAAIKQYKINLEVQELSSSPTKEYWEAYNYPNGASKEFGQGSTLEEAIQDLLERLK